MRCKPAFIPRIREEQCHVKRALDTITAKSKSAPNNRSLIFIKLCSAGVTTVLGTRGRSNEWASPDFFWGWGRTRLESKMPRSCLNKLATKIAKVWMRWATLLAHVLNYMGAGGGGSHFLCSLFKNILVKLFYAPLRLLRPGQLPPLPPWRCGCIVVGAYRSWSSAHRGKWGQLNPIKKRKHAIKSSYLYVYVIFWEQSGQAGVENGAMLTTYLFRYT